MITLSYIICTKNRLNYLKICLPKLISTKLVNEEIVVVDGDSTDGSKAYLAELFEQGKIQQFISEKDRSQAHGWNKGMLMAKGTIIKKIIDDDVFDYQAIRACATYMLEHPNVDVVISNDLSTGLYTTEHISYNSRFKYFKEWVDKKTSCFTFSDVHILIRKSILPYIGLYNTTFTMLDWEYSLRMSYLNANIVFYTGYNALNVGTPSNITSTVAKNVLIKEAAIGKALYGYPGDNHSISLWSKIKIAIGRIVFAKPANHIKPPIDFDIKETYDKLYQFIHLANEKTTAQFIARQ